MSVPKSAWWHWNATHACLSLLAGVVLAGSGHPWVALLAGITAGIYANRAHACGSAETLEPVPPTSAFDARATDALR